MFAEALKLDGDRGYRAQSEKPARVTHYGEAFDSQSRQLLPFARWLKVWRRFQHSYLEVHGHSRDAQLEMQRYGSQLMTIAERYAHHPAPDLCAARLDQAYRTRVARLCRGADAPDETATQPHVRPGWVIPAELFTEILGNPTPTCPRCGKSGHDAWACQPEAGAQAFPPGWPPPHTPAAPVAPPYQPPAAPPQQQPWVQQPPQQPPQQPTGDKPVCRAYNTERGCTWPERNGGKPCSFRHVCSKCGGTSHGAAKCRKR